MSTKLVCCGFPMLLLLCQLAVGKYSSMSVSLLVNQGFINLNVAIYGQNTF